MYPIKFEELKEDYEYYIESVLDNKINGLYKINKIYKETKSVPSPTQDIGNGLMCVLSVACFREATIVEARNVFTNDAHIIDNEFEPMYKFYQVDSHDRYVAERQYQTDCYRNLMKDKEVYYETETIGSTCIVLDVRYSKARDTINFIIMDVHLCKIEIKRSKNIKFPDCQEWIDLVRKLYEESEDVEWGLNKK